MQRWLSDKLPKKTRIVIILKFTILFLFCTPVDLALISPMIHAGDLHSQSEKLYRIRSLTLTPEFACRHARKPSILLIDSGCPAHFCFAVARLCRQAVWFAGVCTSMQSRAACSRDAGGS